MPSSYETFREKERRRRHLADCAKIVTGITVACAIIAAIGWCFYDAATSRWTITVPGPAGDDTVYEHAHVPSHPVSHYVPSTHVSTDSNGRVSIYTTQSPVYDLSRWTFTTARGETITVTGDIRYIREDSPNAPN